VVPEAEADTRHRGDLLAFDGTIDRVALAAFELYSARREELSQLRINEVKRQVAWTFDRMNRRSGGSENISRELNPMTSAHGDVRGEDL